MSITSKFRSFLLYAFLSVSAFFSIFPFIWIVIGSTNSAVDIQRGKLTFGNQLISNFSKLFGQSDMGRALFNSAKIALFTVFLSLLITSMAAYGFQMYKSKAREKTYSFFLLTMMIPKLLWCFACLTLILLSFLLQV